MHGAIEMAATPVTTDPVEASPPSSANPAIAISDLRHRYAERTALDGVSFEVKPAEIFGLLGPNGSGKTTLFRILSTLMPPTSGHALLCGFDVGKDAQQVRRHIGVVFQAASVDEKLTAAENLRHQGHLYGLRGKPLRARVEEMLAHVGLADRAREKVETFSGGMQRRVELAKGLLHRPSVLLLDEPTTGLDPGARIDLWQYLKILRDREQVSVLVTTHLMEEGERCDRLAILNEGKVVALGTPAQLKQEVGGDVIVVEATDAASLCSRISARLRVDARLVSGKIRIEHAAGQRLATQIADEFGPEIQSISVSRPTLEDVFIRSTGHRFWTETGETQKD